MNQPLVSIIVPCYNHEAYIEACIDSVLRQTYPNTELIVIDDGSTDDSPRILEGLHRQHGFHYERQSNMGFARTLNKAIGMASGKYVAYIGSDDIMMPDKTEKQVAFLESRSDIAVCGGNIIAIDAEGNELPKQKSPPYRELDFADIFLGKKPGIAAPTAMIRKEVLDKEGGYDPSIALEDMYMWLKLTYRGYKIAGLDSVLLYYRKHPSNTYKNYEYMVSNLLKTYASYRDHPQYETVVNRMLIGNFVAAAKRDKHVAISILRQISPRHYSLKVLRGMLHLARPRKS